MPPVSQEVTDEQHGRSQQLGARPGPLMIIGGAEDKIHKRTILTEFVDAAGGPEARIVVIPNTLEVEELWVSKPLEAEVEAHPNLKRETDYLPMPISADGTLDQAAMFPHSVCGRRSQSPAAR